LKTVDALHISLALLMNANLFVTNDKQLKKINELRVLILDDFLSET